MTIGAFRLWISPGLSVNNSPLGFANVCSPVASSFTSIPVCGLPSWVMISHVANCRADILARPHDGFDQPCPRQHAGRGRQLGANPCSTAEHLVTRRPPICMKEYAYRLHGDRRRIPRDT